MLAASPDVFRDSGLNRVVIEMYGGDQGADRQPAARAVQHSACVQRPVSRCRMRGSDYLTGLGD